mmetsp:Transcript_5610/g.16034  ORF Transcript_5610/g.16034 Transcript_5610/m.16034 type:complete len:289 (-) Transcript_5610:694-1560(-)
MLLLDLKSSYTPAYFVRSSVDVFERGAINSWLHTHAHVSTTFKRSMPGHSARLAWSGRLEHAILPNWLVRLQAALQFLSQLCITQPISLLHLHAHVLLLPHVVSLAHCRELELVVGISEPLCLRDPPLLRQLCPAVLLVLERRLLRWLGVRSCLTGCLGCLLPLVDVQVVIFLMRQRRGIEILHEGLEQLLLLRFRHGLDIHFLDIDGPGLKLRPLLKQVLLSDDAIGSISSLDDTLNAWRPVAFPLGFVAAALTFFIAFLSFMLSFLALAALMSFAAFPVAVRSAVV